MHSLLLHNTSLRRHSSPSHCPKLNVGAKQGHRGASQVPTWWPLPTHRALRKKAGVGGAFWPLPPILSHDPIIRGFSDTPELHSTSFPSARSHAVGQEGILHVAGWWWVWCNAKKRILAQSQEIRSNALVLLPTGWVTSTLSLWL